ncbi:MAG: hypothetical protein J5I83_06380 [Nitrosomonas communis]|nr:hypothetical protein [Nitrosomonas communis]
MDNHDYLIIETLEGNLFVKEHVATQWRCLYPGNELPAWTWWPSFSRTIQSNLGG